MSVDQLRDLLHRSKVAIKEVPSKATLRLKRRVNAMAEKTIFPIPPIIRGPPEHWLYFEIKAEGLVAPEPFLRTIAFEILKRVYPEENGAVQPITVKCIVGRLDVPVPSGKIAIGKTYKWENLELYAVTDDVLVRNTLTRSGMRTEDFDHLRNGMIVLTADYTAASVEVVNAYDGSMTTRATFPRSASKKPRRPNVSYLDLTE